MGAMLHWILPRLAACIDRRVFAGLYRRVSGVLDALKILKPETVIRWHRGSRMP
jgi:hypothetical protein